MLKCNYLFALMTITNPYNVLFSQWNTGEFLKNFLLTLFNKSEWFTIFKKNAKVP